MESELYHLEVQLANTALVLQMCKTKSEQRFHLLHLHHHQMQSVELIWPSPAGVETSDSEAQG